tara:strand:- start:215 stop:724 length:510 start_codon:yes stop_codon:yes gene_type:complete
MNSTDNKCYITEFSTCPTCNQEVKSKVEMNESRTSLEFTLSQVNKQEYKVIVRRLYLLWEEYSDVSQETFDMLFQEDRTFSTIREAIVGIRRLSLTHNGQNTNSYYSITCLRYRFTLYQSITDSNLYANTEDFIKSVENANKPLSAVEKGRQEINDSQYKLVNKLRRQD